MSGNSLPKQVYLLGNRIAVSRAVLPDAHGLFTISDKTGLGNIQICDELLPAYAEKILFHELVHAVLHFSGVVELLTDEQEEAVVCAIEHGLFPL